MSRKGDRRTKAYRTKLERQKRIILRVVYFLLSVIAVMGIVIYALFSNITATANAQVLLSPIAGEYIGDKNPHCVGEYEKLFCNDKYDWDPMTMIAIAMCESGLNPEAIALEPNGSYSVGLTQINSVHGYSLSELVNPEMNVYRAYQVYERAGGYTPWSVYGSSCFYAKYAELAARNSETAQ